MEKYFLATKGGGGGGQEICVGQVPYSSSVIANVFSLAHYLK